MPAVAKATKAAMSKPKAVAKKEPLILSNRFNKRTPPEPPKERNEKGIIYVKHLPHGFFEAQLRQFFGQFGEVTRVHVARSKKTLRSRGYAYVEFRFREVAQIAAETMNNYLMFGKILKAGILPAGAKRIPARYEKAYDSAGKPTSTYKLWLKRMVAKSNGRVTKTKVVLRNKRSLAKLQKMKKRFAELGVDYDVDQVKPDYAGDDLKLPKEDEEEAKDRAAKDKRKADKKAKVDKLAITVQSAAKEEKTDMSQNSDDDDDDDEDASFLPLKSADWDAPGSTDSEADATMLEDSDERPPAAKKLSAADKKKKTQAVLAASNMKQQIDSEKKKANKKPPVKAAKQPPRPLVLRPPSTSAEESSPEKPVKKGKKQKALKAKAQSPMKSDSAEGTKKEKKLVGGGITKKNKDKKGNKQKLQKAPEASSVLKSAAKSLIKDPDVRKVKGKDISKKKKK